MLNWLKIGLPPPFSELVFFESARSRSAVPTANHIHIAVFYLQFGKEKNAVPSRSSCPSLQLNWPPSFLKFPCRNFSPLDKSLKTKPFEIFILAYWIGSLWVLKTKKWIAWKLTDFSTFDSAPFKSQKDRQNVNHKKHKSSKDNEKNYKTYNWNYTTLNLF